MHPLRLSDILGVERALIGVIHTGALPGTPTASEPLDAIAARATAEARIYRDGGFHALIVENMHDRPYLRKGVGPEIVAAMTRVAGEVRSAVDLPLGIQVLAGANRESLAVALACGARFVRVEGFVFAHVADEGVIESDAGELLRYRRAIGAEGIAVFADVKKKHAAHALTADVSVVETARAAAFFLADGVIVTGAATGVAADPGEVRDVRAAVQVPVLTGSGVTPENVSGYAADGVIVGSWVKQGGVWSNPLDRTRVEAMARAFDVAAAEPRV